MKTVDGSNLRNRHFTAAWNRHRIAGLTLVELMVAITIGLIILAAVARLFVSSRSTYNLEESLARVQESGRFAMEFLAQDIRMAGYAGCSANLSGTAVGNLVDPPADVSTFNPDGIAGYKHVCSSSCSGALTEWAPNLSSAYFPSGSGHIQPIAGSDVVIIQRADTLSTHLTGNSDPSNANIQILNTATLASSVAAGDILMVSDCKSADVFKTTNTSSGSGKIAIAHSSASNTSNFLTHSYENDAELMKLVTRVYFIGRRSNTATNPPALFRRELANNGSLSTYELVEGIEVMRFSYGEDTDATGDRVPNIYRNPSSVSSWRKVMSARVGLLVKTLDNVDRDPDTRTYDIAGNTAGPYNDNVRRRAFNSTIQLRNHF
jgi:type IV pilus assembly protein PilW